MKKSKKILLLFFGLFITFGILFSAFSFENDENYRVYDVPENYTEYHCLSKFDDIMMFKTNNGDTLYIKVEEKFLDTDFDDQKESFLLIKLFNNEN